MIWTLEPGFAKKQEIPSGHDPANYVTKRLMAEAHDGELIPVSILYKADTKINGSSPYCCKDMGHTVFLYPPHFLQIGYLLLIEDIFMQSPI